MTATLFSEIEEAPPEPELTFDVDDVDAQEAAPVRTRQRKPRQRKIDPETGQPVPRAPRQTSNAKFSEELLEATVSIASELSAFAPTLAGVLVTRAEALSDGLVALAAGKKRTTAALRKIASVSKIAGVLEILILAGVAAMVDFGRIDPESAILDYVGFAEILRDDKGKMQRDERGMVIKERQTLRDIYNVMHPEATRPHPSPEQSSQWQTHPTDVGMPYTMPPMNWTPH